VNRPIHFNEEIVPLRAEIHDEGTDDGLPTELRAEQSPVPQGIPQQCFRPRRHRAELSRPLDNLPHHLPHSLSPSPLPLSVAMERGPGGEVYFPSVTYHWYALFRSEPATPFGMRFLTRLLTPMIPFGKSETIAGASAST
jgi:hypothetical protein